MSSDGKFDVVLTHMHALLDCVEAGKLFGSPGRVPHPLEIAAAYRATKRRRPGEKKEPEPVKVNTLDSQPEPAVEYPPLDDVDDWEPA